MRQTLTRRAEALIVLAGGAMRVVGLGRGAFWHDEAFSGLVAELPWPRFWEALLGDVHPPLWYLIERAMVEWFGPSEITLRLPAALFSLAALLLFWRVVRQSGLTPTARLAALALMAISPFQVYYSQEARMYSALTMAAVVMMAGIQERRPRWFAAGAVLALWLHNLGAIYVLVAVVALLIQELRGPDRALELVIHWTIPAIVALLAASPAIVWTCNQLGTVAPSYWIIDKSVGAWLYNAFFCAFVGQGLMDSRFSWNASAVTMLLAIGGLLHGIRHRRWTWVVLGWLPGLLMLAISNLVRPLLLARTLIGASPALYLLAGQLFNTRRRQVALTLAMVPLLFSGLYNHYGLERRGDTEPLVAVIEREQPAELLHSQTGAWILMAWQMPDWRHYLWDGAYSGLANAVSDRTAAALGMERAHLTDLPRPVGIVYSDYALISPEERVGMLAEMDAAGAELVYTLADDENQRIDLWMLR